jgi:hypothetical protein
MEEEAIMASQEIHTQPSFTRSSPSPDNMMGKERSEPPILRRASPSPSISPTPAIGACPALTRCVSTGSCASSFSDRSSSFPRELFGSASSRLSSASYTSRQSFGGLDRPKRRGYVRPQGTNFAASAQSRESVLSLGSIAHLQYYFARTGLLDGKGGRLAKRKEPNGTLDLSLDTNLLSPAISDRDSSYSSTRSSPELAATAGDGTVESPIDDNDIYYEDDDHTEMLPPTVSTYNYRSKPIPRPPTLEELKDDLTKSLTDASKVLQEALALASATPPSPRRRSESDIRSPDPPSPPEQNQGWYELQGMHILDIMTLAIRAAKRYYTAHEQPARLAAIKSERKIRSELFSVLEVLKRMATRNFSKGMRTEERETMENWVSGLWDMLRREEEMEQHEMEERRSWTWLDDSLWPTTLPCIEREYAFLKSMDPDTNNLPPYSPLPPAPSCAEPDSPYAPSPFLKSLQNGVKLVRLHNAMVRKSKRPFGAISTFHTNTAKPYRCADNLRYWIKAAELRWEVILKVNVMDVVNGVNPEAWTGLEVAVWKWAGKIREEISGELR